MFLKFKGVGDQTLDLKKVSGILNLAHSAYRSPEDKTTSKANSANNDDSRRKTPVTRILPSTSYSSSSSARPSFSPDKKILKNLNEKNCAPPKYWQVVALCSYSLSRALTRSDSNKCKGSPVSLSRWKYHCCQVSGCQNVGCQSSRVSG